MNYLWVKGLHVAAALVFVAGVIAGALLLSALRKVQSDSDRMSLAHALRILNRATTTPAMLTVWALGLLLLAQADWSSARWLQLKFAAVLALSALHGAQSGTLRAIAGGRATVPSQFTGHVSLPIGLAVLIAILATTKPF
jgi:putative membrane protein